MFENFADSSYSNSRNKSNKSGKFFFTTNPGTFAGKIVRNTYGAVNVTRANSREEAPTTTTLQYNDAQNKYDNARCRKTILLVILQFGLFPSRT
jgi:hypothetical protein